MAIQTVRIEDKNELESVVQLFNVVKQKWNLGLDYL